MRVCLLYACVFGAFVARSWELRQFLGPGWLVMPIYPIVLKDMHTSFGISCVFVCVCLYLRVESPLTLTKCACQERKHTRVHLFACKRHMHKHTHTDRHRQHNTTNNFYSKLRMQIYTTATSSKQQVFFVVIKGVILDAVLLCLCVCVYTVS